MRWCKSIKWPSHVTINSKLIQILYWYVQFLGAPWKFVLQSLAAFYSVSLWLVDLLTEKMKLSVSKPPTISMWITLVLRHVNRQPHLFDLTLLCLMNIGPNRFTSVLLNGYIKYSVLISSRSLKIFLHFLFCNGSIPLIFVWSPISHLLSSI